MKKLLGLIKILIVILLLFACEKEEKPTLTIVGKWKCYEMRDLTGTYPRDFTFEFKNSYDAFIVDGINYGTWEKDIKTLYITPYDDYPYTYSILLLTDEELELKKDVTYYFHRMW